MNYFYENHPKNGYSMCFLVERIASENLIDHRLQSIFACPVAFYAEVLVLVGMDNCCLQIKSIAYTREFVPWNVSWRKTLSRLTHTFSEQFEEVRPTECSYECVFGRQQKIHKKLVRVALKQNACLIKRQLLLANIVLLGSFFYLDFNGNYWFRWIFHLKWFISLSDGKWHGISIATLFASRFSALNEWRSGSRSRK